MNSKIQAEAPTKIVVHPLVLLSAVDHFDRMKKTGSNKRVMGVLLGQSIKGVLDVSNSFAVPFDEDDKNNTVWFLDHDYMECMYGMFRKVSAKERIVGWYHTGPKLHEKDTAINELIKKYCPNSVLVIINVQPTTVGLPTDAYVSIEKVHDDGTPTSRHFIHVPSEVGAEEAEEVGVEHLLRDVRNLTYSSASQRITDMLHGVKGLYSQLFHMIKYLHQVNAGKLPMNQQILSHMQDILNLLPDMSTKSFTDAFYIKTNDDTSSVYLCSLIRCIIALHSLIENKVKYQNAEKEAAAESCSKDSKKSEPSDTKENRIKLL